MWGEDRVRLTFRLFVKAPQRFRPSHGSVVIGAGNQRWQLQCCPTNSQSHRAPGGNPSYSIENRHRNLFKARSTTLEPYLPWCVLSAAFYHKIFTRVCHGFPFSACPCADPCIGDLIRSNPIKTEGAARTAPGASACCSLG